MSNQSTTAVSDEDVLIVLYGFALAGCATHCIGHPANEVATKAFELAKAAESTFRNRNNVPQHTMHTPTGPVFKTVPIPNSNGG